LGFLSFEPRIAGIADSGAYFSNASGLSFPFDMIYTGEMSVTALQAQFLVECRRWRRHLVNTGLKETIRCRALKIRMMGLN